MKLLLLIVTAFSITCSYAQDVSRVVFSVVSKETLLSKVQSDERFANRELMPRYTWDTLDFNVVGYWGLFENPSGAKDVRPRYYTIDLLASQDTIFFKRIFLWKDQRDSVTGLDESTTVLSVIDTPKLSNYIDKHNKKYFSSWTLNDFLTRSRGYGWFGYLCGGFAPRITKSAYALAALVKANDSLALKKLASSFTPEERAFGTMGLLFLTFKGQQLSDELLQLITVNQESDTRIDYCGGCIIGDQPMKEGLRTVFMKYAYQFFVEQKLL